MTLRRGTPPTSAERKIAINLGDRQTELNTILIRIRGRRDGEPTTEERDRIKVLRTEIADLKRGQGQEWIDT